MTHATCRLTAKNRDQLRNPTLGNRVWVTFLPHLPTAPHRSGICLRSNNPRKHVLTLQWIHEHATVARNQVKQVCVQPRQLGCQHDTARICCRAPCCGAVAAERRRVLSIYISCLPSVQQQTHRTALLLSNDGTDRRTDGLIVRQTKTDRRSTV